MEFYPFPVDYRGVYEMFGGNHFSVARFRHVQFYRNCTCLTYSNAYPQIFMVLENVAICRFFLDSCDTINAIVVKQMCKPFRTCVLDYGLCLTVLIMFRRLIKFKNRNFVHGERFVLTK